MWVTPRDLEILARVHAARACDSATLGDLFPTVKALQQRLWRLTRERFLKVHRVRNQRVYSLARRGVQALGISAREVRVSHATAVRSLLYARVCRKMEKEGYVLNGQDQVGRVTVIRAWRDGHRVAVVVSGPDASPRTVRKLVDRLRSLVNPFKLLVDELMIFGTTRALRTTSELPIAYHGRITIRLLPP